MSKSLQIEVLLWHFFSYFDILQAALADVGETALNTTVSSMGIMLH